MLLDSHDVCGIVETSSAIIPAGEVYMRAIVAHEARDLRIEDHPTPDVGPGQVLVRTAFGGICGSDLHYYHNGGFGAVRLKQPMVLGHEVSGIVERIGDGVSGINTGDLIAVSPSRPCGSCSYCHEGLPNHCTDMRFYGSAMPFPHIQGAFQEFLLVEASQCVNANGLSPEEAALSEPLSVGLHATRRAGELLGKRVLVAGSGPIGGMCILAARRAGAAEIVVVDLSDNALAYASRLGADVTIKAENGDALEQYQGGKGYFDVMYECSGAPQALASGMRAMRPRGVVMQLGLGGDMQVPMMTLTAKELDLRGSFRFHEEFAMAVKLMLDGLIDVKPLISHTLPLNDAVQAFDIAGDRSKAMKTLIQFH